MEDTVVTCVIGIGGSGAVAGGREPVAVIPRVGPRRSSCEIAIGVVCVGGACYRGGNTIDVRQDFHALSLLVGT